MHLSSGCPSLAKWKYRIQHDIVGKHINWLLLKMYGVPAGNEWYSHVPNVVTERDDGKVTIYWDKPIKTDRKVSYNRPDVVVIDSEENTEQGTVPAKLSESLEKLEIEDMIGSLQTAVLISTTAILRRVLNL